METTVAAPAGAEWIYEEVATGGGKESLGQVPLLEWKELQGCVDHYGVEGVLASLDGTSLRVSYQSIARRMKSAGKSNDEIATAIVNFKPGRRVVAAPTPVSRAKSAAAKAAESVNGDALAAFLAKVAAGAVKLDEDGNIVAG
jgi:hypothetical protein